MRQKRAKTYRKLMSLYGLSFGFRQPYQVLVDADFCKDAHSLKTDILKQLSTVLQGTVKPMITQCCIHELYLQGKALQPVVDFAKTLERRKCNHREAIAGDECLADVVGDSNKHRYVIAGQSSALRVRLRKIPAVPLVHITRSVMILEPPSEATLAAKDAAEEKGQKPSTQELAKLKQLQPAADEPPRKKRKGPKGPNPLSVKKKKGPTDGELDRTRKRHAQGARPESVPSTKLKDEQPPKAPPQTAEVHQVGEKRKRESTETRDDTEDIITNKGSKDGASQTQRGHKRRRKRGGHQEKHPGESARMTGDKDSDERGDP